LEERSRIYELSRLLPNLTKWEFMASGTGKVGEKATPGFHGKPKCMPDVAVDSIRPSSILPKRWHDE